MVLKTFNSCRSAADLFVYLYVHILVMQTKLVSVFLSYHLNIPTKYSNHNIDIKMAFILPVSQSAKWFLSYQSAALKEVIDDLEWPGSSIQIKLQPAPPSVIFRGEGHGDLQVCFVLLKLRWKIPCILYQRITSHRSPCMQIDFSYYANTDLLIAFSCDRQVSHRFVVLPLASSTLA